MKTIYLRDENYRWKKFEYSSINELKQEFENRHINIGYRVSIGDDASIGYRVSIGDYASIGDNTSIIKGIYFNGSKFTVTWCGNDRVQIGCKNLSISEWKEIGKKIGTEENFTDEQIEEYSTYIDLIEIFIDKIKQ